MSVRKEKESTPGPVGESSAAAAEPADKSAVELADESAVEPAGEEAATGAVEPAGESSVVVAPAEEPAAVHGRPGLVSKQAAARRKSWVINPAISPKVVVNMTRRR